MTACACWRDTLLRSARDLTARSKSYNKAVGSLESRVLVSARKFAELGASVAEDIPELEPIETTARALSFDWDEEEIPAETADNKRKAG